MQRGVELAVAIFGAFLMLGGAFVTFVLGTLGGALFFWGISALLTVGAVSLLVVGIRSFRRAASAAG